MRVPSVLVGKLVVLEKFVIINLSGKDEVL